MIEPCVPKSISKPDLKKLVQYFKSDGYHVHYYKDNMVTVSEILFVNVPIEQILSMR